MIGTLLLAYLSAQASSGCRGVAGDRIVAADLAAEFSPFSAVPADAEIALAPAPGVRRLFPAVEIERLAERFGLQLENPHAACFERRLEQLDPERVRAALIQALGDERIRLEVVDFLRAPVPGGSLEFPRHGLSRPANGGPALWRGRVRYGAERSFPVWAKVRLSVEQMRVVALRALAAGQPIEESWLEVRKIEGFPFDGPAAATIEEVAGRLPRRPIPAGQAIDARQLVSPREVESGSKVEVEARAGAMRLAFEAKAESSGRTGDTVVVRNPSTGKRFRGVVQGKGRVAVEEAATQDEQNAGMERDARGGGAGAGADRAVLQETR